MTLIWLSYFGIALGAAGVLFLYSSDLLSLGLALLETCDRVLMWLIQTGFGVYDGLRLARQRARHERIRRLIQAKQAEASKRAGLEMERRALVAMPDGSVRRLSLTDRQLAVVRRHRVVAAANQLARSLDGHPF